MSALEKGHTVDPAMGLAILEGALPYLRRDYADKGDSPLSAINMAVVGYRNAIRALAEAQQAPATELTLAEISRVNLARALVWHPKGLSEWSVADWAVAMAGEAGEACNAVKKLRRLESGIASSNAPTKRATAVAAIADEIADTFLYLDLLAQRLDLDLAAAVVAKFNAVSEREGFSHRLPEAQPAPQVTREQAIEAMADALAQEAPYNGFVNDALAALSALEELIGLRWKE